MSTFNFDDYPDADEKGFDFDAYPDEHPKEMGYGEALGRASVNAIPIATGIAGGVVGSVAGPLGTAAGAGLGAAGGKALENILENYLYDDERQKQNYEMMGKSGPEQLLQTFKEPAVAGIEGLTYEMGGQLVAKGLQAAAAPLRNLVNSKTSSLKGLYNRPQVEGLEDLMSASERIGVKPVEAMKTSNKLVQNLESGLAQSGTIPASGTRQAYDEMFAGLDEASKKISSLATPESQFSIGKKLSEGLEQSVQNSRAPVAEMYGNLEKELIHVPVDPVAVKNQFAALKRQQIFKTKDGIDFLSRYGDDLMASSENLADLKEFRTNLRQSLPSTASDLDRARLEKVYEAITRIRDGSIGAVSVGDDFIKEGGKGARGEAANLMSDVALADAAHASNMKEINSLSEVLGAKKGFKSTNDFLRKLGETSEEELTKRASNSSVDTLMRMKEQFPQIFEKAREARVNEMIQKATGVNGAFNEGQFIKNFDKLGKEYQEMFFDQSMIQHINDLKTVKMAIPEQIGPSGTPKGLMTMDMFNPKRTATDYLIKKSIDPTSAVSRGLDKASNLNLNLGKTGVSETSGKLLSFGRPAIEESFRAPLSPLRAADAPDNSAEQQEKSNDKEQIIKKTEGSKYSQVLQNAAAKGDASFNAAHYILSQRDPAYRKQLGHSE